MAEFHPDLVRAARFLPRSALSPRLAGLARYAQRLRGVPKPPRVDGMSIRDVTIPGPRDNPELRIRLYSPHADGGALPALLWIHGGGFVIGTPEQDARLCIELCRELGMVVAAVNYRLSPEHPFPAPIDDCYAALLWLFRRTEKVGIAPDRIVIGGASAGAGLAAGLTLMAHDRGEVPVAFQLLIYPMLDDRTTMRSGLDEKSFRLWSPKSNRHGWQSYLGCAPGGDPVSDYATPARRESLAGLPPAWLGVGTCDLFHDEDVGYGRKLNEAGVQCEVNVVEGAFHGFDLICPNAPVSQQFRESYKTALRVALSIAE